MRLLLTLVNLLNMYQVVWQQTHIDIPLDAATSNYYEMPEAKIYHQGKLVSTDKYYYERGVNRTSLSVVNSNHVKAFKIDYRITFYELGITSEQTITFNIVDEVPPTILKVPAFRFPINSKIPSDKVMLEGFYYQDNYYDNDVLVTNIKKLNEININMVGIYEIEYEVMDPSFNISVMKSTYEVFDNNYPEITMIKNEVEHLVNASFNVYEHFKFKGVNLIIDIDISAVNFELIGTYPLMVTATNQSNLSQSLTVNIKIVDNMKPVIKLKSNINDFNVYEDVNRSDLLDLILIVDDNYDNITMDNVLINTDLNTSIVGKYIVVFTVYDSSNNKFSIELSVNIKDLEKPKISLLNDIILNINDDAPYYPNYFEITDNYDSLDELSININDKGINYKKLNTYYLEVTVTDRNKNVTKAVFPVNIRDLISPLVTQVNDIFLYNFKLEDNSFYKSHFSIVDNFDSYDNINLRVIDKDVNYELIGSYPIDLVFYDTSNNETLITTTIYIIDTNQPEVVLYNDILYHFIGDDIVDVLTLIKSLSDDYDDIDNINVEVNSDIDYEKIGKYDILLVVSDSSGNSVNIAIDCYVDIRLKTLIRGEDIAIIKDGKWQPYMGINFTDDVLSYEYYNGLINTNQIGYYEVIYVAYDKRGNIETFKQKINVVEEEKSFRSTYLYIMGITIVFGTIFGVKYYQDNKNKRQYFDKDS